MPNFLDHVKMTVSGTPGTGTITLGSAVAGFQSFAGASATSGATYPYEARDGDAWELGWGVYTTAGTTLARTLIASSTGSLISLTSSAIVSVVAHKEAIKFSGCRVTKASDQTGANYVGGVAVAWDSEIYDTDGFHDNVTNNNRLTPPSGRGINYVELVAHWRGENHTSGTFAGAFIRRNGTTTIVTQRIELTATSARIEVHSGPVAHTDGDWYEVVFEAESDTTVDVISVVSFFSIRVVG